MGKQTMKSKIRLSIFFIAALILFSSCKKEKAKTENSDTKANQTEVKKPTQEVTLNIDEFYGAWTEPVPGFETELQGFMLKKDGTAVSLNVDTPLHMKWSVKGNKLTFAYQNDSLKEPDVFIVEMLNDTVLKLKMKDISFNLRKNDTIKE